MKMSKKYIFVPPIKFCVFPVLWYKDPRTGEYKETEIAKNLKDYVGYLKEVGMED